MCLGLFVFAQGIPIHSDFNAYNSLPMSNKKKF